uniref:Abhydrolase domain-containing protein 11 n=1 Tax=Lygus hesperus TaxID=30085 RepID=A0A0A9YYZ4_LYGHE
MAMDVIYLMDQRKFNKACLIGHSMGGRAMMRVALSYELDIRQFLLSNLTKVNGKFRWKANITSLKNSFENIVKFPLTTEVYKNPVLFVGGTKSDYLKCLVDLIVMLQR